MIVRSVMISSELATSRCDDHNILSAAIIVHGCAVAIALAIV